MTLDLHGRDIICAECPQIYSEDEITGRQGDESRSLAEIFQVSSEEPSNNDHGDPSPTEVKSDDDEFARSPKKSKGFRRLMTKDAGLADPERRARPKPAPLVSESVSARDRQNALLRQNLGRLGDWQFFCPKGHPVDGNRGLQIPVGVVGPTGASKSHFLPGLVWETNSKKALSSLGISIRAGQFTSAGIASMSTAVYVNQRVLPPTPPTSVQGPFGYRLSLKGSDLRYSLLLFDVGGEALSSIVRIRQQAPYVLLSKALFILIDPEGLLPTKFDAEGTVRTEREHLVATTNVREGILRIVDALEELNDQSIREIPLPICFVIAKADSIDWPFPWEQETSRVLEALGADSDMSEVLIEASDSVREAFSTAGGALVVEDILETFDMDRVRFVAASATSEMPSVSAPDEVDHATEEAGEFESRTHWTEPTPNGIALGLLHLLSMLGVMDDQKGEAENE